MSVFGGDSWAREAQNRKRRVDDLILLNKEEEEKHCYKKLSNGKYACLVCPNNPVVDSSLILSMHNKGSRHIAAEYRVKEKELVRQEEINKRIALLDNSGISTSLGTSNQKFQSKSSPLIERTRKAASEILKHERSPACALYGGKFDKESASFFSPSPSASSEQRIWSYSNENFDSFRSEEDIRGLASKASGILSAEQQLKLLQRRETELKFTAAGWKRDGYGKWFRDENVEFDSDEEDPNVCLS